MHVCGRAPEHVRMHATANNMAPENGVPTLAGGNECVQLQFRDGLTNDQEPAACGSEPDERSGIYSGPTTMNETTMVTAWGELGRRGRGRSTCVCVGSMFGSIRCIRSFYSKGRSPCYHQRSVALEGCNQYPQKPRNLPDLSLGISPPNRNSRSW